MKIDLANYKSPSSHVYSGRDRGMAVRSQVKLDQFDSQDINFQINIPPDTMSINVSFFLGLFGPSVRKFGADKFQERFEFTGLTDILRKNVREGVERALKERSVL